MSVYKAGGIAVPLFILFGPEALEYRLHDSEAKIVFVEVSSALRHRMRLMATVMAIWHTDDVDYPVTHALHSQWLFFLASLFVCSAV